MYGTVYLRLAIVNTTVLLTRPTDGARLGVGSLVALALLPLALIWLFGLFPAGQLGRVQWNSGRPELSVNKVSAVRLS